VRQAYERSEQLGRQVQGRVFKEKITPHWFRKDACFWYRNDLRSGKKEFILVDAEKGERRPAFDHAKLASALSQAARKNYSPEKLPFASIDLSDDLHTVRFEVGGVKWECDLQTYACSKTDPKEKPQEPAKPQPTPNEEEVGQDPEASSEPQSQPPRRPPESRNTTTTSPDGKWVAFIKDFNVHLRPKESEQAQELTKDGKESQPWGNLSWSPDSQTLIACKIEPGDRKEVYLIESSPAGGGRAKLHSHVYPQPGDKFSAYELWLFDLQNMTRPVPALESGVVARKVATDRIDFSGPPNLQWKPDGSSFTYEKTDRGHQRFRVIEVDARTGKARHLIDERSHTFINTHYGGRYLNYLKNTEEIIYRSERDGWAHLYLIDMKEGKVKNQITKGPWVMRGVQSVDPQKRQLWFWAGGMLPEQDPYHQHLCRINFDGTGLVLLTPGNGTHTVQFSPDKKYLLDTYTRVDLPPVHELRRAEDGKLICIVDQADTTALEEIGWKAPEVFHAKGRDGTTDIWGIVYRPRHFDPAKKYPVIEAIYAGPHSSHVPKTFSPNRPGHQVAELGFIVVQIDGMGTANRSKAFHDVCWHNIKDAGFPDRKLWIKALAEKYPYVDVSRIGIFGTSAGGQNAMGALLFHGDFYKVAVAACGCHDNRMDKSSWNEQWMGYPVGPHYADNSNITHAGKLKGKLFLIVGELDRNVPPESTLRTVDAMIKAGKDFDLLVIPGAGHTDGGAYGMRRTKDFFVRHLLGVEPPDRNAGK
jgi:dipeptidyl aminopeptidase/acylaminoacyl peptidase